MALGQFFSENFGLPLSVSFRQSSILTLVYMLLSPGHAWEPFKMPYSFGNRGALDTKVLSLFAFKGLITDILALVYTDRYVFSLQMRASCIQVCQVTVTTRCRTVQPPPWRRSRPWQPALTPDRGKLSTHTETEAVCNADTSTNPLTLRRLMSYIYMEHPFLMFLDHTQRRSTVGRTPLDE